MSNIKGLNNMGNTCYLNAGFQMLVQNENFCELVHQQTDPEMLKLSKFIKDYHDITNSNAVAPQIVKQMVDTANTIFKGNNQHDSSEFIIWFIDYINSKSNNAFSRLFQIETLQTVKCKIRACLTKSYCTEKNNYMILPIKPTFTTLTECYQEFKIHEKLEADDMFFCENCNAKRIASRKLEVSKFPKHLIIILKRFGNDQRKIDTPIDVPFTWRHNYELQGAVIHSGSYNGGHYTYVTKSKTGWNMCDDSNISPISEDRAEMYFKKAFILYYKMP
jgi:ubiquitin C-terminal hydrolase